MEHRNPPSWVGPGRPLPSSGGLPEDVDQVVGRTRRSQVGEGLRESTFERIDRRGHAYCPSGTGVAASIASSATMTARSTESDRWRRDLAVPRGIPTISATS